MKKKLLAVAVALCLAFGGAAALPQNAFTGSTSITASADTSDDGFVYNAGTSSSTITGYKGSKTDITIPPTLGGKPVTLIADGAFKGKNIKTVILAASVTGIGYNAFQNCTSMTAFVVPYSNSSLKEIGNYAFDGCTALTTFSYFDGSKVTKIGNYAFRKCSKLASISLPSTLTSIGSYAFKDCSNLQKVNNLQKTTVDSLDGTFNNCSKLSSISFPSTVKTLTNGAFENNSALNTIDLSGCTGLKAIGNNAFKGCTALKTVYMPSSLETLDEHAFYDCKNLTGTYMFKNCKNLKSIKKECFTNCEKLTSLYVPYSVTEMAYCSYGFSYKSGSYGFYDCSILLYNSGKAVESAYRKANEYWYKNFTNYFDKKVKFEYLQCTNHNYTDTVTTPATCTQKGIMTHTCIICGDSFTTPIDATGHTWNKTPSWKWTGVTAAKATFSCTKCTATQDVNATSITSAVTKRPNCTATGIRTYTSTVTFGGATYTNDMKQSIAATGHSWNAPTFIWSADGKTCIAMETCKNDSAHTRSAMTANRLSGSSRYETATAIADEVKIQSSKVDRVFLVNADKFADALAGVPLAVSQNAVILLAGKNELPDATMAEIKKLGVKNITILGGNSAIGKEAVEDKLTKQGYNVTRIKGSTRYETATKVAESVNSSPTGVFIVYSQKFPDALAISSIAAKMKAPILYVDKTGALDANTKAYLTKHKSTIKKAYVIGGKGAVSDDVKAQIDTTLGITSARIKGSTRYETCLAVLNYSDFKSYTNGSTVCVTTGEKFPDALAGGVFAANNNAPVYLVNGKEKASSITAEQKAYLATKKPSRVVVFGGKSSVPNDHVTTIMGAGV